MNKVITYGEYLNESKALFKKGDVVKIKPEFIKEYKKRVPKGDVNKDVWKITSDKGDVSGIYPLTRIKPMMDASSTPVMNAEEEWLESGTFRK